MDLESLVNHPAIIIASLVLGFMGVILAIVFYFRSQKNKTPCFDSSSTTLIQGLNKSLDGLEIQYKGLPQECITITKIVFWNDGRETIDGRDLVKTDPLRIICPNDIEILDIQIVSKNQELNSITIGSPNTENDQISYPLSFDYLDNDEHILIQLVHNGAEDNKFIIEGKIKGVKNINKVSDVKVPTLLFKFLPLMSPFEKIFESPAFFKYFGSLLYFSGGVFACWNLFTGNTQWYVWLLTPILFLSSGVMYFGFRHISPIKI